MGYARRVLLTELIGDSPGIAQLREQASRLLGRSAAGGRLPPTLIVGETGTGKGLLARALHAASARRKAAFVDVNCASIPENLLEAELFGVERGAFTGADRARPGLFQAAHRGTLFLDEIALLSTALQSKLLKALEDGAVRRVGSTRLDPVDAWLLAATNERLDEAMRAGRFRSDLYHRLSVITFRLPPLRERGEDVLRLADHFLAKACAEYGLAPRTLTDDARAALRAHPWPGNVRELANVIERVVLLSEDVVVTRDMLELAPVADREQRAPDRAGTRGVRPSDDGEREQLVEALEATGWNLSRAAARLALPRNTLRYRMERHGLREPPPSRRPRPAAITSSSVQRRLALLRIALGTSRTEAGDARLAELLADVTMKIGAFGGRAEDVMRDGLVAAFGLEPVEDAATRAVLAVIAVRNAVERARRDDPPIAVSAAIDVQDCALVAAAGDARIEIAPASRATAWSALAALMAAAAPEATVITEAAAATLRRRFALGPPVAIPGRPDAVRPLVGPEPTGLAPEDGRATFAGRGHELALLESRLAVARGGRGQVVSIVGEAGIGKSRLLHELARRLPTDTLLLEGRCTSYGAATPYLVPHDLVRAAARIDDGDDPLDVENKIRRLLGELDVPEALWSYLQTIGSGTVATAHVASESNPGLLKARTLDAVRHLVLALARRQPLVLVVEDAHWIDRSSDELLATLVDAIAASRSCSR